MPLSLYRRHHQECTAARPRWSTSSEFQEKAKTWKRCGCPIIAAGSLSKVRRKRTTGQFEWDEARAAAYRWESAGHWPSSDDTAPGPEEPPPDPSRMTLALAVEAYLAYHLTNSAKNTWLRYQSIMRRITAYTAYKGYLYLDQWAKGDVVQCRDMWTVAQRTANADMSVVRAFFEFGVERDWIISSPAARVKNFKSRDATNTRGQQKQPFSDAELARMYEACDRFAPKNPKYAYRSVTGRDLSDFISVSTRTGLRISDASTFRASRMNDNGEVVVRTTKRGEPVSLWVEPWLQQIIRRRALAVGDLIFGEHRTTDKNVIAEVWRRNLHRLWKLCGPWDTRPTPHRLRHTFARLLLATPRVEVKHVAELMGDTEDVIRKYYSAWVPGRQDKITAILKEAFAETPRPAANNVIEMKTPVKLAK
jgi:integrase